MGGEAAQLGLYLGAYGEGVDEGGDALGGHLGVGAGELLEGLVGMRISLAAQYGLNSLGHYRPHRVEIAVDRRLVEDQFRQPLERALHGDDSVGHGDADVAEHRGVGQVALQA